MGIKGWLRERLILAVQYAVREEMKNNRNLDNTTVPTITLNETELENAIVNRIDKQIERWTWERYKRLENYDFPKLESNIDSETWSLQNNINNNIEKWTWDRFERTDKAIEKWTWDRFERTDKAIEKWTWDRFERTDKAIEKWTWDRFQRTFREISYLSKEIDSIKQSLLDILFEQNKIPYIKGEKIRVVMLFQIPSCWPSVASMWEIMAHDDRYDATVLLYDKEQKEKVQMYGAREFLIQKGIPFIEAEKYDFDLYKPHVFIYQTPWDEQHRPSFLYSDAIKKRGIRVAYIPYGIEYSASVKADWVLSIMQFKAKPWMSFSLSEQVKQEHRMLSKYSDDFLKVTGYPKFDSIYERQNFKIGEEISQKVNGRKKVFWQMHFPALNGDINYPEPFIDEYIDFLKKVSKYNDLFFFIRPHPKFLEVYEEKGFKEEVERFRLALNEAENVYLYDVPDYRPALVNSDYIIGDRSALMIEALVMDVPVLYMTNFYYKEKMLEAVQPIFDSYYQGNSCYDMERFIEIIVRKGLDYKKLERETAKKNCLPFFDGKCGQRIVDAIAEEIYAE